MVLMPEPLGLQGIHTDIPKNDCPNRPILPLILFARLIADTPILPPSDNIPIVLP
jgi:hypothetical protein